MIPRTTDVAKMAAISDRQPDINQQQAAEQFKQAASERQHQVETAAHDNNAGSVTTENLDQERRQGHPGQEENREKHAGRPADEQDASYSRAAKPADPVRGHIVDIKT